MDNFDLTTPQGRGQGTCAPTSSKYVFDPAKCVIFDTEIYPGRWCVGFNGPDPTAYWLVDGDRDELARTLDHIAGAGLTLVGYNSMAYDLPVLRSILGSDDPYEVSRAIVGHTDRGLPEIVKVRMEGWPRIKIDHIDLAARTKQGGWSPTLKLVAASLGARQLRELPYSPDRELTNAEWGEVINYNRIDLDLTRAVLNHFEPDLQALAALSAQHGSDLRSVHPAGVAQHVLCAAYRARHGVHPHRLPAPPSVRYVAPGPVIRPRTPAAAEWFDRLTSEEFPLHPCQGEQFPQPVIPSPAVPIIIGAARLTVGRGGLHSVDQPALYRTDPEYELVETDVVSYYPSMMARYGISPRGLGDVGRDLFRELLAARLDVKARAASTTDKEEAQRLKVQAAGLKIVINSVYGQFNNGYSPLYDPEAALAVTTTGQLLLVDLVERLDAVGAEILSVNTDGLYSRVRRDDTRWREALADWQAATGMALETVTLSSLLVQATNNYATCSDRGVVKRRGTLRGDLDWNRTPNLAVVADAVVMALLHGILPEHTIRAEQDPLKFTSLTRRERAKAGYLVDDTTGVEVPLGRLARWYKAQNSPLRIEHRWTTDDGTVHKTTPPEARGIRLLMDLPDHPPADLDIGWYVAQARKQILANRHFEHLDPKWLEGHAGPLDLHNKGLVPCPKWDGKKLPKGAEVRQPSFFWRWDAYESFATYTGAAVGILALDVDEFAKFRKWVDGLGNDPPLEDRWRTLDGGLVSYHRDGSAEAVRAGRERGKLLFRFEASDTHPLARIGIATLKPALGIEIFYGKGAPTVLGSHPDGPGQEYLLDGRLGNPPGWLIEGLETRASKRLLKPKARSDAPGGNGDGQGVVDTSSIQHPDAGCDTNSIDPGLVERYGQAALENEVAQVEATPEGARNTQLWESSCALGGLVGAGALDRAAVETELRLATTLSPDEAEDVIRRGLDKGAERPRDLGRLGNGDLGRLGNGDVVGANSCPKPKPMVIISVDEHKTGDQACAALKADPEIYQRGGLLVRVLVEADYPEQVIHAAGAPKIAPVPLPNLRERLVRCGDWRKRQTDAKGKTVLRRAHPPTWAIKAVDARGEWDGVRHLEGVIETPIIRLDGSILDTPGYDSTMGLLFEPGTVFPAIPPYPTREEATAATTQIFDLVKDFPFLDRDHRAAWLAALLTPLARFALPGPCPLFLFDANQARTGKTKLVDVVSLLATGRQVARTAFPATDEEMDKRILAIALAGFRMILFDNIETGANFGSAALDAALTGTTYSGRVLGASKWATDLPLTTVFYASGNNIALKGDILGRIIYVRLESQVERPEERDDFAVKDLLGAVRGHRGRLVSAALTLLRGYHVAGRPTPDPKLPPMGEYLAWTELVRYAVHWATGNDPCATKAVARSKDRWATQLPAIIAGWVELCKAAYAAGWTKTPTDGITASRALEIIEADPGTHAQFKTLLVESSRDGKLPTPQRLGNDLGKVRGKVHQGQLLDALQHAGVNLWIVLPARPRS